MALNNFVFTSESVSEGHPDKVADQISDAVLDELLRQDPNSRVACETFVKTGMVLLGGEITTRAQVNYEKTVRQTLQRIGYSSEDSGFPASSIAVLTNISEQSPDIAQGVDEGHGAYLEQGAGDQGLMFGFACNETPELMPLPIALSHRLVERLAAVRHNAEVDFLRPDSKSQVTVRYENGVPVFVDTVVISTQHAPSVSQEEIRDCVLGKVVREIIPAELLGPESKFFINPTGRFILGGPQADAGLTGRKIIVDTYGGYGRHGGGAFSGKDPSKVDRSGAYAARYLAKNIVAAGLADRCEIQVAYAIGVARPVSVLVDTFGTGKVSEIEIANAVSELFDLRPKAIIDQLNLLKPIYQKTASYGHFGRTPGADGSFSWERTDLADKLKAMF